MATRQRLPPKDSKMTEKDNGGVCVISVIIAHLNQPDALQICLESLQRQNFDLTLVEIIVVDNGSHTLPTDVVSMFKNVRLEFEAQAGPGPARNKGVAVSKGTILAFIDSDCVADRSWLSTISRVMQPDSGIDIAGGKVKVGTAVHDQPNMVEAYEQVFSFRQDVYIKSQGFSGSGNLATRRDIFERVGSFGGIEIAEDVDWGRRATRLGIITHYIAEMIVTHPARKSLAEIYTKLDRLVSHEFAGKKPGLLGNLKWFAKALAVAGSPLASWLAIPKSDELRTWRDYRLAGCGLTLVRLYRARKMLSLQLGRPKGRDSHSWNRG